MLQAVNEHVDDDSLKIVFLSKLDADFYVLTTDKMIMIVNTHMLFLHRSKM